MNRLITIQEANALRLREIDPSRIDVDTVDLEAGLSCATDSQHGKAVCLLQVKDQPDFDLLCLRCAVEAAELWLTDPEQQVSVVVAR